MTALVVIPPMTQLNTPYPAGPQLVAYLKQQGYAARSYDAAIALANRLYSRDGLRAMFTAVQAQGSCPDSHLEMLANEARYCRVIDPLRRFLQGRDPSLAGRIVRQTFLPQGPRFAGIASEAEQVAFGRLGQQDHARWLGTLVLQDIADLLRLTISPHFGLTSYGSSIADSATSYEPLASHLATAPDPLEQLMLDDLDAAIPADCRLLALTCPFPGNLPAALRIAEWVRAHRSGVTIALGGGYPSTELRELAEPRLFDLVDTVILDDGEAPLAAWCARAHGESVPDSAVVRSFVRDANGAVRWCDGESPEPRHGVLPAPDYSGIALDNYLDLLDTWNPMHRLWNEGRWLKLTAAHGCYWKRCTFCDTNLPYIGRYDPARASTLADRMDALSTQTGYDGFHFTDEAAPPRVLLGLALELLRRDRSYHHWGNIRFDDYFTPDRCRVLAAAGMVGVSGGIEVADDTVLKRIDKGVSIPQLARVLGSFAQSGVLVHGYLMYGFPGQTTQQTIDSLEVVRQLMANGLLHSGFWHRFTVTAHSAVGRDPAAFGVEITGPQRGAFAWNNLRHHEPAGADHEALGPGLSAALAAWLSGAALEGDLADWFEHPVPSPSVAPDLIEQLMVQDDTEPAGDSRAVWLGEAPSRSGGVLRCSDEAGELLELDLGVTRARAWCDRLQACLPTNWDRHPPRLDSLNCDELLLPFRQHGLALV
ncbi:MAG: radical SAM protein [Planctomycetota bacterium]|jgi:hypothetical protein|nr:radical SAM protein [Planctomycetota bacterium]